MCRCVALVALLVGVEALGCIEEYSLLFVSRPVAPQLEDREMVGTAVVLLPRGQLSYGTSIVDAPAGASSGTVTGGRLIIQDIETGRVTRSLELPSVEGKPSSVSELGQSADGRFLGATSGYLFGGPALIFETNPQLRYLHSTQPTRRASDLPVLEVMELLRKAETGDQLAIAELLEMEPSGGLIHLYSHDHAAAETAVRKLFGRVLQQQGISDVPEPVPAIGLQFDPSGDSYLVNSGDKALIVESRTGRLLHEVLLHSSLAPQQLDPPSTYFVQGGRSVAALSRHFITLWDIETGTFQGSIAHPRPDSLLMPVVPCPNANALSVVYAEPDRIRRVIWRISPQPRSESLLQLSIAKDFSEPRDRSLSANTLLAGVSIPFAFSSTDRYAVALRGGSVEVGNSVSFQSEWAFELGKGLAAAEETVTPQNLDLSSNGKWLAVNATKGPVHFIELWSVDSQKGVRLMLPEPQKDKGETFVRSIRFSPEGEWLSVLLVSHDPKAGILGFHAVPYVVDVYRALAIAK